MQILFFGITGVLLIVAGILSARLWCYRKQIAHMKEELFILEQGDTNYRLSSYCRIGKTEEIIETVNRIFVKYKESESALKSEIRSYRESITSISHDIRTPLTSAKGYIQMMRNSGLPEEKKQEYTKIVERRLYDVTDMLNQLFEYARIEAGEMDYEAEVLNAGNLFAETLSMFYEDFKEKGCEPEVLISQTPCHILADRHAYVRIIENLIKNALVHGTGGFLLSLGEEHGYAVMRVSNRTDSIEYNDIDRIFDRFYTTDQSRTKKTTGLGLAIVKRFAEKMDGNAKASLEDGCFTVEVKVPCIGMQ